MSVVGWLYKKQVTITGQSGAGTDYQVPLIIGESSGSPSVDFHMEGHSDTFPSDGNSGDIRFLSSDDATELDFWIEKVEGTTPNRVVTAWVKVDDNLDANKNIYCYYGKSSAPNVSSISDTFLYGMDFEDNPTETWSINSTAITVETSTDDEYSGSYSRKITIDESGGDEANKSVSSSSQATAVFQCWIKATDNYSDDPVFTLRDVTNSQNILIDLKREADGRVFFNSYVVGSPNYYIVEDAWYLYRITIDGTNSKQELFDSNMVLKTSLTGLNFSNWDSLEVEQFKVGGNDTAGTYYFDNILLRKFNTTEPDFSSAGAEIEAGILDLDDTITTSDAITLSVSQEKLDLDDILSLSDVIGFGAENADEDDILALSDNIEFLGSTIRDISQEFRTAIQEISNIDQDIRTVFGAIYDMDNKINTVLQPTYNIDNQINTAELIQSNISNYVNTVIQPSYDFDNICYTQKRVTNNISNDIRTLLASQVPGDAGFQSLGKTYIRVYIDSVEQTDINIDSISISEEPDAPASATFTIARAFDDSTQPTEKELVEIKYDSYVLFKGYISQISKSDNPDTIQIVAQDKMWTENDTTLFFAVGHVPEGEDITYYSTIASALSTQYSLSVDFGGFVPQNMNFYGSKKSDILVELVNNAGNYNVFYDTDENIQIATMGSGDIIELDAQVLGSNIKLHNVISHSFNESVDGLINKFFVQMGDTVTKHDSILNINSESETNTQPQTYEYTYAIREYVKKWIIPAWSGPGWVRHDITKNVPFDYFNRDPAQSDWYYDEIFTRYTLPILTAFEGYDDYKAPLLTVYGGSPYTTYRPGPMTSGFSIDYRLGIVTLNQPMYVYSMSSVNDYEDHKGWISEPGIELEIWKSKNRTIRGTVPDPSNPPSTGLPEEDEINELAFYTAKMGDYAETITGFLALSGFNIQTGYSYRDESNNIIVDPGWNDTSFARDKANWELSKTCDKKITGEIEVTLDTLKLYNITLKSRIKVNNARSEIFNIDSIDIDISNFTATIRLTNARAYKRTVSIPQHSTAKNI